MIAASRRVQPVFNVLDTCHRDLAVADDVAAGWFTIAGRRLELGTRPDWTCDPHPADKEWRVEWAKFAYGLDLAHAAGVTRNRRYVRAWASLVESFIDQRPPASDDTEVAARRIQYWIYAWNRFEAEAGTEVFADLGDGWAERWIGYLWSEVLHVREHLTSERNHRTLELYALLVAAIAVPDCDPGQRLRTFALEAITENLLTDLRADGVHREASTHYHCIVLRSYLGALEHARRSSMTFPDECRDRLVRACEFMLHCHRPDGRIAAFSDADGDDYRDVLALAARLLGRPDFLWGATGGVAGAPPAQRLRSFPHGGYHIQRSGWGTDDTFADARFLMFDCGPLGDGGHGHYDLLSLEAAAYGRPLLVDPGRYTYAEGEPNWRWWFKGTAAHNTVTVDGRDQTPYRRRKPKGPIAQGRLLTRMSGEHLDLIVGVARSPQYGAVHTRAVCFVAREYWVVVDWLESSERHDYQLRWHLSPDVGLPSLDVLPEKTSVRVHGLSLVVTGGNATVIEPGWYAPSYGVKHPAPVVVTSAQGSHATFGTLILPSRDRARRPADFCIVDASPGGRERLSIDVAGVGDHASCRDRVTWVGDRARWTRVDDRGRTMASGEAVPDPEHGR